MAAQAVFTGTPKEEAVERMQRTKLLLEQALRKLTLCEAKAHSIDFKTNPDAAYSFAEIVGATNGLLNKMDKIIF